MAAHSSGTGNDTICDLIRRWAKAQPDAPALLSEDAAPLSYERLAKLIDDVRHGLNAAGLGRGDRVGIVHSGGADMMSAILGVMSDATAVPLNPKFSAEEFARHLRNSKVSAVLMESGLESAVADLAGELGILVLEMRHGDPAVTGDIRLEIPTAARPRPNERARFEDIALVMATSGTTSAGKVVALGWRQCMARRAANVQRFRRGPEDCCYVFKPLYYHSGVGNCMDGLFAGGKTLIVPRFDFDGFVANLISQKVTWMSCGPAFLRALRDGIGGNGEILRGNHLRYVNCGTSRLDPELAEELERLLGAPLLEGYATTETGRLAYNPLPPAKRKLGTVGLTNPEETAVMAPDGTLLGPGERGEIVGRGDQVFEGYENDPAANRTGFVHGWFRTGDEGFIDEDGYLTLTGRIKEMINRGGDKVSPAEVDTALMGHPGVGEAATFPIPHPSLGEEVAAAVVRAPGEPGEEVSENSLRRHLLDTLVAFKVPRRFVFVEEIPKDESGKVRRYELAAALGASATPAPGVSGIPTRNATPLEASLQAIWARVLKRDTVGLDENFFLLGGDSLKAVDLFLEIENELKRRLPVAALFEAGTVAEMAELIGERPAPGCMVPIQPDGVRPPFFCVHGNAGEVIGFYNVAKHMGIDQPFYGIQSVGWDGTVAPFTSNEEMAAHYVAEMRKVQPQGPYYFGGYSFGGRVAIYMARQLQAAGQEIALLAIIDSSSYAGRHYATLDLWLARRGNPTGIRQALETGRFLWFKIRKAYDFLYERLRRFVLFRIWDHYRRTGRTLPRFLRRPSTANKLVRLAQERMRPYEGDAVYFKARPSDESDTHPDTRDTWDRLIMGRLDVVPVPGTHPEIIQEPFAGVLAVELRNAIDRAMEKEIRKNASPAIEGAAQ